MTGAGDTASPGARVLSGPNPRRVAALVTPIASSVMTASMPLATDFSARTTMTSTMIPKNPAVASVSHIGKVGACQICSSDEAQFQSIAVSLNAAANAFSES